MEFMKDPPEYLVVKVNHIYIRTSETLSSDELGTSVNMTQTRHSRGGGDGQLRQSNDDKYCPVITRQGAIFTTVGNFKTDIFLQIPNTKSYTDYKSESAELQILIITNKKKVLIES